ncbi:MAG: 2Fe-2S iron-sulfur cluster binding domain-containing protein [Phycisphaerae bacterium]|nr:2Fe-2S iron-sulfur cluster binding domain-containing protein [Phycisphaerae bacterium]
MTQPETCTIDINAGQRRLEVAPGRSLFETLASEDVLLPSICGGDGRCGCCQARVLSAANEPTPAERKHLTPEQLGADWRLTCQVSVRGDLSVEIPEEFLAAKPVRARLEWMQEMTYDIRMLRFALIEPERIAFRAGQYIKLNVPTSVATSRPSRPFSFANPPSDDRAVELIVRHNPRGVCTNWIFNRLQPGHEVRLSGPYGHFGLSDTDLPMVWVAGGSGLSAFCSMLRHMAETGIERPCTLYFGAVARRDLYLLDELHAYQRDHAWFAFAPALSAPQPDDDWGGETGLITDVLDRHLDDGSGMEAYLCGSPGMLAAARKVLAAKGIGPERTFYDAFIRSANG